MELLWRVLYSATGAIAAGDGKGVVNCKTRKQCTHMMSRSTVKCFFDWFFVTDSSMLPALPLAPLPMAKEWPTAN